MAAGNFKQRARFPSLLDSLGLENEGATSPTFSRPMPMARAVIAETQNNEREGQEHD